MSGLFLALLAAAAACGRGARVSLRWSRSGKFAPGSIANVSLNPDAPIAIIPTPALSDELGALAIDVDRRDRGGSRTRKIAREETSTGAVLVPSQTLLQLLSSEQIEGMTALKVDVEGFEDVILGPFFHEAPPRMWPRLIIIEDCRDSWKVDLMSIMLSRGYAIAAPAAN